MNVAYRQLFKDYPDAVNFEQYRQMLGMGRNQAYKFLHEGKIPYRKNGKKYIIAKINIIKFLIESEQVEKGTMMRYTCIIINEKCRAAWKGVMQ